MCEEEKTRSMLQRARPIAYRAARRAIGDEALRAWAQTVERGHDPEPDLSSGTSINCYRSRYDALPCVFVVYRRVRHIFI